MKNSDTTLMRATSLAKDRFGTQAALDDAQAAEVKAHSEVDQATASLSYENQQLVVIKANEEWLPSHTSPRSAKVAVSSISFCGLFIYP